MIICNDGITLWRTFIFLGLIHCYFLWIPKKDKTTSTVIPKYERIPTREEK